MRLDDLLKRIKDRIDSNYEKQEHKTLSDLLFLYRLYQEEHKRAEKYWEAANTAELRVQELEEIIEGLVAYDGETGI